IKLSLRCVNETTLATLKSGEGQKPIDSLRFYLNGEPQVIYPLYEMLFNHVSRVELKPGPMVPSKRTQQLKLVEPPTQVLPPGVLRQVGFDAEERLLQYTARSFAGYGLLSEYFSFPDKFLFFDVTGLERGVKAGFDALFDINIYLEDVTPLTGTVNAETFQ